MPYLGIIDMCLTIQRIVAYHDDDYGLLTRMKPQFSAQACDVGHAFLMFVEESIFVKPLQDVDVFSFDPFLWTFIDADGSSSGILSESFLVDSSQPLNVLNSSSYLSPFRSREDGQHCPGK